MIDYTPGFLGGVFRSPAFKLVLIGTIILLLMIPLLMVWGLVSEREHRAMQVRSEVASSWGPAQSMIGPYLIVPFTEKQVSIVDDKPVERMIEREAVFLPDRVDIGADVRTKILHRSIYDVTVFNADLKVTGRFNAPDLIKLAPDAVRIKWRDAVFALALGNVSGLKATADLMIDGQRKIAFEPSLGATSGQNMTGIHAALDPLLTGADARLPAFDFAFDLAFAGSDSLYFAPAGRKTTANIKSDWPHPSFGGAFLPDERKVRADGFAASWQIPHLARSVPQSWVAEGSLDRFGGNIFGVRFYIPLDFYNLVDRALKYGLMFLTTAFAGVFVMEMLSGKRVHGVQYLLVGVAMVFFFVMLLSFAEHIGFALSYLLAAGATGGMLSVYVGKALDSLKQGLIMLALFFVIYGFLYMILQLEDYALLAGAIIGFVLLTVTMFLTLRIDWSGRGRDQGTVKD